LASHVSRLKSGRGLPQSKTLARNATAETYSVATGFLKTL
jgi:23S rRNA maturation mini-RNase III